MDGVEALVCFTVAIGAAQRVNVNHVIIMCITVYVCKVVSFADRVLERTELKRIFIKLTCKWWFSFKLAAFCFLAFFTSELFSLT